MEEVVKINRHYVRKLKYLPYIKFIQGILAFLFALMIVCGAFGGLIYSSYIGFDIDHNYTTQQIFWNIISIVCFIIIAFCYFFMEHDSSFDKNRIKLIENTNLLNDQYVQSIINNSEDFKVKDMAIKLRINNFYPELKNCIDAADLLMMKKYYQHVEFEEKQKIELHELNLKVKDLAGIK